jgi:toxin ParE1/3/4
MKGFVLSPAAKADLDGIWHYTFERWNIEQAERYVRDIVNACQALADERKAGRAVPEIRKGYYKLAVRSHFVFYRLTATGFVDVVRILHQRMDIPERLQ